MVDEQPELHDLTKMLLKRMESNPEEFFDTGGYKWRKAVETVREHGLKHEKDALNAAIHKIQMDAGLRDALKVLLLPPEEENEARGNGVGLKVSGWPVPPISPPTRNLMEVERHADKRTVFVKFPDGDTFLLDETDLDGSPLTKALISRALRGSK